ncbi:MAG: SusC/RagA family TonB-linked outer membrane protein, partial [Marinilabiliaceae bacterium]|nr:SusC/RagA family TonB-linked outer membrane protein [Marinilabiliaceae bacterium]
MIVSFIDGLSVSRIMMVAVFCALTHWSVAGVAQEKVKLTLGMKNVTMETVIDRIEQLTGYAFLFQGDVLDVSEKVSVDWNETALNEVLNNLVEERNVKFVIANKQIILSKKGEQPKRTVHGLVTDQHGEPIVGATVVVKGNSSVGTITDFNGRFNLVIEEENAQLMVSFIGMKQQIIEPDFSESMEIVLENDNTKLDEVVVTAMGIERKAKSLTYATQTISNKDITRAKDANFINALQGKAAGLVITPNAGGAGSASKILLRGNSSIEGNNSPLIVVDGIPMNNSVEGQFDAKSGGYNMAYAAASEGSDALSNINPDDIASITLLKGANAAALYGSAAANGVIIVKTKQGREGAIRVDVSSSTMFETPLVLPQLQDHFGGAIIDGQLSGRSWGKKISDQTPGENVIDGVAGYSGNDISKFFDVGSNFTNSVALSGGSEKVQSYFSFANTTANGMVPNNKFQRNSFTARQTYKFLNDDLKLDVSANYINQKTNNRIGGGTVYNPLYNLYLAPRNIDMDYYKNNYEAEGEWMANPIKIIPKYTGGIGRPEYWKTDLALNGPQQVWFQGRGVPAANNPYWLTNRLAGEEVMNRIYGTLALSYRINDTFNVQSRVNYDRSEINGDTKRYATLVDPTGQYIDRGDYAWYNKKRNELFADFLLNYHQIWNEDLTASATLGGSLNKSDGNSFWMRNYGASSVPYYDNEDNLPTTINV